MQYPSLDNGQPFEIIESNVFVFEADAPSEHESEKNHSAQATTDAGNELSVANIATPSSIQHSTEQISSSISPSKKSSDNTGKKNQFDCLVIGVGNYGCQNIDYLHKQAPSCSFVKINADFIPQDDYSQHILVGESQLEKMLSGDGAEEILTQLDEHIDNVDMAILVASLEDNIGEVIPLICQRLSVKQRTNLSVLFKPNNHIRSKVEQANAILDKITVTQNDNAIENPLTIVSIEKASQYHQGVISRNESLYAMAYNFISYVNTILEPQNSSTITFSQMSKMLSCSGGAFFGCMTVDISHEHAQEGILLDNLLENIQEKSLIDGGDLFSAPNVVMVIKSSDELSTALEGELYKQIGRIANDNNKSSQLVELSYLYDESVAQGSIEIIMLVTGIQHQENVLEQPDSVEKSSSKLINQGHNVIKLDTSEGIAEKNITPPAFKSVGKQDSLTSHSQINPSSANKKTFRLAKPPTSPMSSEENIAILKTQRS